MISVNCNMIRDVAEICSVLFLVVLLVLLVDEQYAAIDNIVGFGVAFIIIRSKLKRNTK